MSEQFGFIALGGAQADGATTGRSPVPPAEDLGFAVEADGEGGVRASRTRPEAPQVYLAVLEDGVLWGTDLAALVAERTSRGVAPAAHPETVLAYLRGNDVATGSTTFFEGIQRLDVGDELTVSSSGTLQRRRGEEDLSAGASPAGETAGESSLARSLSRALEDVAGATVLVAEDMGSAALLAEADAARAITVHGGALTAGSGAPAGTSRALEAVATRAGIEHLSVRPSTEQFKKDLADLVRTQVEPVPDLSVYAHYTALRRAAETAADSPVLDATGPRGAGFASRASHVTDPSASGGIVAGVRELARSRRRRHLDVEVMLDDSFVASTAAAGHRPSTQKDDRDSTAVLAARRNAARFGVDLRLPLLDPAVRSALRAGGASGEDQLAAFASLANPSAAATRPERGASIDTASWTSRLKTMMHQVFRSEVFARRPWNDQRAVLESFEAYISGGTDGGAEIFWRLFLLELWMREVIDEGEHDEPAGGATGEDDEHGRFAEPDPKEPLDANAGKQLDIELSDREGGSIARRYPVRTGKFSEDSAMDAEISRYVGEFFTALDTALDAGSAADHREATIGRRWNVTVSEKIIAIMQGRSYFVWDVKPTWWATTLSRYVARTPAGIGLGDPVTMELAIREAGLPRVLAASAAGAAGKLLRRKGLFYHVVGGNVRAIDGPTEYSVYPANVSAKLPPKDPDKVAAHLNDVIRKVVPERWKDTFTGTVVMDANDIGRNTLGKAAPLSGTHYELQFADNPLGQGREQTPMAIVFER